MSTSQEEQERIRLYLLGELGEADEEAVELRLLADAGFAEELGIVEEELVDEYADGQLAPADRARLERRFFDSPQRRRKLRVALALRAHAPGREGGEKKINVTPLNSRRARARFVPPPIYLKAAAALLVAVGLGLAVWWMRADGSDVERGMAALNEAFKNQRVIEPRVTAVSYAPLVVTRGRENANADPLARRYAERLLMDAATSSPGARSSHALGRFYLLDAQFGAAVEQFEQTLRHSPDDAQAHSDLGAALLELGRQQERGGDPGKALETYGRALEHVNKATELDARLLEPFFNRALVLEYQGVPEQAKEAWRLYLARDSQSNWAEEARRRLKLLSERAAAPPSAERLLEDFLAAARSGDDDDRAWRLLSRNKDMIASRFLPQQLAINYLNKSDERGAAEPAQFLDALTYAGRLERERARDPYVAEMAAYYARASAQQRALLREAQAGVVAGYSLCKQSNCRDALGQFLRAKELFEKAGDAWEARLCEYWIAYCYSQVDRLGESTALLMALAEHCRRSEYKWLFGQATCWIAANYAELADHSNSIRYYEAALPVVEEIGDAYNCQKVLSQLASQYNHIGQPRRALEYNWRSLRAGDGDCSSVRQLWRNYLYTARSFINLKLYHAAAAYGGEMLHVALHEIKEADFIQYSYLYLGQFYGGLKRYEEALRLTTESLGIARTLSEKAARKQGAFSVLQIAHLQRQAGRCADALPNYDLAIETYNRMELSIYKYDAHKGRLLCLVALGDEAGVEAELPTVLGKFAEYRRKIPEEQNLNAFADREQGVYDIAIDHAYEKGDGERAFDYSEESRARSLLDTLRGRASSEAAADNEASPDLALPARPTGLREIKSAMPPGVQAVQYAVLEDKTLIWLVARGHARVIESDIGAAELDAKVSAYLSLLTRGPSVSRDELARLAAELYDKLFAPVAGMLDPLKVVCVIPDKAVSRLPFNALRSNATGRYLVSDFTLMSAPSLNVFLHCSDDSRGKAGGAAEALLSIGNPAFDGEDYPSLPDLPAAAREARGVARLYAPAARELIGPDAMRDAIVRELPHADVIHFAGHYIPHAKDPMSSKLVLAGARGGAGADDGSLSARDLVGRKLPRAKLVVLSACQTGGESYYNGEGLIGISRTFLGTGIPLVVASQWAVDTEATAELMLKFHRYRRDEKRRLPTVAALRQAQLDMLGDSGGLYADPYYWAAFLAVGGDAKF